MATEAERLKKKNASTGETINEGTTTVSSLTLSELVKMAHEPPPDGYICAGDYFNETTSPPEEPTPDEDEEQEKKEWKEAVAKKSKPKKSSSSKKKKPATEKPKPEPPSTQHCNCCGEIRVTHPYFFDHSQLCNDCADRERRCAKCNKSYKTRNGFSFGFCSLECAVRYYRDRFCSDHEMILIAATAGIHLYFFPVQEASDFYLLCNYVLDHPEAKEALDKKTNYLAEQLSNYMLYAIGGELRHFFGQKRPISSMRMEAKGLLSGVIDDEKKVTAIILWLGEHPAKVFSRERLWKVWGEAIEKFSRPTMIKVALTLFQDGHWGSDSVGGKSWALIADTLRSYEEGEISPVTFVDTAFGLKHNNCLHLNKMWSIEFLQYILDANVREDYEVLEVFASKKVKEIIKK